MDTIIVTNQGITNVTGRNTIEIKKENYSGCALDYYYFKDNKCIIDAGIGKLYFFAKKESDCANDSLHFYDTPMIIHDASAKIGNSWSTCYGSPVANVREFVGIDTISTPAGTFICDKYELTIGNSGNSPVLQWFSTVGLIKEELDAVSSQ